MEFNLDVRLKQLESLEQYISSSRDKVQSILDSLKWDVKEVVKEQPFVKCSLDSTHRVPINKAQGHEKVCCLRKEGYDLKEEFLSESMQTDGSIIIDHEKKIEILSAAHRNIPNFRIGWNGYDPDPQTADRVTTTFSPDERSALHSYVIENAVRPPEVPEFNTSTQPSLKSDEPLTLEQLRIQERNAKRRRIKYKSIHTNRKSHKEVLREVIDGQMEIYKDWLTDNGLIAAEENGLIEVHSPVDKVEEEDRKSLCSPLAEQQRERAHSVVSKNSTHSGSSKRRDRDYDNKRDRHRKYNNHSDYYDKKYGTSRDYKRRKSRERSEYKTYPRSPSRYENHDKSRHYSHKER